MHESARSQYQPLPHSYLNTAGYGLPTRSTVDVMQRALGTWREGTADWVSDWDSAGDRCRGLAAAMLGGSEPEIALLPAVSVGAGVVLSSFAGEVLVPDDEFASVLLPALANPRLRVRRVPFDQLAASVTERTAVVVTSQVRSNDGRVQDIGAVLRSARQVGAAVLVDATHAAGILPIDPDVDFVLAAAYKHLLCPRGVAFMRIAERHWPAVPALAGSWRSAASPHEHYYGPTLDDLAPTAARYDVSLAWHAWAGAEPALSFLDGVPAAQRRDWCVGLADHLAKLLAIEPTGSSIVAVPVAPAHAAREALRRARVIASGQGEVIRLSFHLYNDIADAERAAEALSPFVHWEGSAET